MYPGTFAASISPSCVLYPLLSHSGPRPPLSAHCGGAWGLAAARPVGFCPACVSDPGKEREGECGGVSRWLVPRGPVLPGCRLLPWAGPSAQRSCSPVCGGSSCSQVLCSLYIRVVCQPKGNSDYVRHLEGWGAATPLLLVPQKRQASRSGQRTVLVRTSAGGPFTSRTGGYLFAFWAAASLPGRALSGHLPLRTECHST